VLDAPQRQLAPQRLTHDLAAGAAGFCAGGFQLLLKGLVKPDGEQRFLHGVYCDFLRLLAWRSSKLWCCQHEGHALQVARDDPTIALAP